MELYCCSISVLFLSFFLSLITHIYCKSNMPHTIHFHTHSLCDLKTAYDPPAWWPLEFGPLPGWGNQGVRQETWPGSQQARRARKPSTPLCICLALMEVKGVLLNDAFIFHPEFTDCVHFQIKIECFCEMARAWRESILKIAKCHKDNILNNLLIRYCTV